MFCRRSLKKITRLLIFHVNRKFWLYFYCIKILKLSNHCTIIFTLWKLFFQLFIALFICIIFFIYIFFFLCIENLSISFLTYLFIVFVSGYFLQHRLGIRCRQEKTWHDLLDFAHWKGHEYFTYINLVDKSKFILPF